VFGKAAVAVLVSFGLVHANNDAVTIRPNNNFFMLVYL